jgi:flagellar hook-associated protein FlgK
MTDILSIGASAIQLYQKTLATVSNNVANLNTEGYTRQEAVSVENNPSQYGIHFLGSGAGLQAVKRNYDEFVETNLRSTLTDFSTFTPLVDYTSRILDAFSSDKNSLTSAFDRFFNVAERLTLQPDGLALRNELLSAGDFLASRIKYLSKNLSDLDVESGRELSKAVETVNSLTAQLASINQQLGTKTSVDRQPPALLDQRDKLLNSLSALVAIDVTEEPNGVVSVAISDAGRGGVLLNRTEQKKLSIDFIAERPGEQMFTLDKYGEPLNVAGISSGKLGGIASFRSDVLVPLMDELDYLSNEFVANINLAHRQGINLNNERGGDLFTVQRQFNLVDTSQAQVKGVQIVETRPVATERNIELAWMGNNSWLITDKANNQQSSATGTSTPDGHVVTFNGLQMTFSKLPDTGTALILRSTSKASQGIAVALTDPAAIAAANRMSLSQPESNTASFEIELSYVTTGTERSYNNAVSLNNYLNRNVPLAIFPSATAPALQIPAGISDFLVSFMPPVHSDQSLQLLTSEFNHLLGAQLDDDTLYEMAGSGIYNPESRYLDSSLNLSGEQTYRQNDYFYGHKAAEFSLSMPIPVQTNSSAVSQTLIAAGNLVLNGEALPALTLQAGATLSAEDITAWINSRTAETGVSASVRDGRVMYTGATVTFSFGAAGGKAADLSRIGLATGVYSSKASSEDLLVYVTGSEKYQIELQVQAGNLIAAPSVNTLDSPFSIRFVEGGDYQIWDDAGDNLIAQRAFDLNKGILHNGIQVDFDKIPGTGDRFDLKANTDSAGDNRNLQGMLAIRAQPLLRGQNINDFYLQKINNVASVLKISEMNLQASEVIYEQAKTQKSKISGVNLDQEAADLIRFQQAYQAAAQIIQASIKMFDTLLNTSR